MMNDRPTVKVIYILDAQNNGKNYFDTVILKEFEIRPKISKIWGKNVKNSQTC